MPRPDLAAAGGGDGGVAEAPEVLPTRSGVSKGGYKPLASAYEGLMCINCRYYAVLSLELG